MYRRHYKIELKEDIILNSSLATSGNLASLDYIPGSVFQGIVAQDIFTNHQEQATKLLLSQEVAFGDATVMIDGAPSYPMPFYYYKDKMAEDYSTTQMYLNSLLKGKIENQNGQLLQLKQERQGFLNAKGQVMKNVKKRFALKSAHDKALRRAAEGQMFGFESIIKGQTFSFTLSATEVSYINMIDSYLTGIKYIGKSSNAEYGRVQISRIEATETLSYACESFKNSTYILVYAKSNLCFTDAAGNPTYQPSVTDLGLASGVVDYTKSQLRTYNYTPWNGKRNTPSLQRNCIKKGSVFYVKTDGSTIPPPALVGNYISEGLGEVVYNPAFLRHDSDGKVIFPLSTYTAQPVHKTSNESNRSPLLSILEDRAASRKKEIDIAARVLKTAKKWQRSDLAKVSPSQWGVVREYATKIISYKELNEVLIGADGLLQRGVAYDRVWSKGSRLKLITEEIEAMERLGTSYLAKLAAQMAKQVNKKDYE